MPKALKRFYRRASAMPLADSWGIGLDGRPVRTPGGSLLALPSAALAHAVAEEWQHQGEAIDIEAMPLTRLAATAIDRVSQYRAGVIDQLAGYGATDLLCYRADAPASLAAQQYHAWQPLLQWVEETFGARMAVTAGVIPVPQPAAALAALRAAMVPLDDLTLTVLAAAVQSTGSLIIGLALVFRQISAEEALAAALLDEVYQAERWGRDAAAEARRQQLAAELAAAAAFMALAAHARV
jgi:chaperone required for assembly of F1-ATPase